MTHIGSNISTGHNNSILSLLVTVIEAEKRKEGKGKERKEKENREERISLDVNLIFFQSIRAIKIHFFVVCSCEMNFPTSLFRGPRNNTGFIMEYFNL